MSFKLAGVIWNDDGTMATKESSLLAIIKKKTNLTTTNDGKKALVFVILETDEEFDSLKEALL